MKIEFSKEWCMRMARLEGEATIAAGTSAFDPVIKQVLAVAKEAICDDSNIVFGKFVRLMRRRNGLTIEKLAEAADVEVSELVEIEDDARHRPDNRTVYQLANYFHVPMTNLMQIAGLSIPKDSHLFDEAIRFAARSEPVAQLSPEESAALEAFVAVLNERK